MHKDDFIKEIEKFKTIKNFHERAYRVKNFLLSKITSDPVAYKTNKKATEISSFLIKNYKYCYYKENQTINFQDVIGGNHCDYTNKSPVTMIISEAKRMQEAFYCLTTNPGYFFGEYNTSHGNPIYFFSFMDKNGTEKFIANEGNHRSAMGLYLQSILSTKIKIDNVRVSKFIVDYKQLELIERTNELLKRFDFKLYVEYKKYSIDKVDYNLIARIVIQSTKRTFLHTYFYKQQSLSFNYNILEIDADIIKNDKIINDYLESILLKIPKIIRLKAGLELIFKSIKESYLYVKGEYKGKY